MTNEAHAHGHGPHAHAHGDAGGDSWAEMGDLLDLDGDVLGGYLSDATAWIADHAAGRPVRRILDVGAGTGTGAFALLERFEGSDVLAVDVSAALLGRLDVKARDLGVDDRVRTIEVDLDATWPALEPVDLVWASSSLHHLADPDLALSKIFRALRPDGLLAVTEMDSFPRFLPHDLGLGRPGLEDRCHAAMAGARAGQLPHQGSDWRSRIAGAGFDVRAARDFTFELSTPLPDSAAGYASASLRKIRAGLGDLLEADDRAVLDALIDSDGPENALRRGDLVVRTSRSGWIATRP